MNHHCTVVRPWPGVARGQHLTELRGEKLKRALRAGWVIPGHVETPWATPASTPAEESAAPTEAPPAQPTTRRRPVRRDD